MGLFSRRAPVKPAFNLDFLRLPDGPLGPGVYKMGRKVFFILFPNNHFPGAEPLWPDLDPFDNTMTAEEFRNEVRRRQRELAG